MQLWRPEDLEDDFRAFLAHGLAVDPWLAGLAKEHFAFDSQTMLAQEAAQLDVELWREPLRTQTLDAYPVPIRMGRTAAHETLVSTAATIAHERRGRIHVTPDVATEAIRQVGRFVADRGFGALVRVYSAVTFVENHGAVRHYGAIAEEDFVRGNLHRPWVGYALDDELLAGIACGLLALEVREGRRVVTQTATGETHYQNLRRVLAAAGFLDRRLELIALSQFNLFEGWDRQVAQMAPEALAGRQAFTAFAGLSAGMKVLEAGCGMASQTFEGGLWAAVGPAGSIAGIDPAPGMLERAQAKAREHDARNVSFRCTRAEDLSMFKDGAFDAAVGVSFLHLADIPRALAELRRVTRPGGRIAIFQPCRTALDQPWFRDRFAPILAIAEQHAPADAVYALLPGKVPALGELAGHCRVAGLVDIHVERHAFPVILGDPDVTVAFFAQGISFFQRELEYLPWQALIDLLEVLKDRGRAVCAHTTLEERTLLWPTEFVRARVPAP